MIRINQVLNRECECCEGKAHIRVRVADAEVILCRSCARQLQEALKIEEDHEGVEIEIKGMKKNVTRLEDFLKKHPKAILYSKTGTPAIMPSELGYCGAGCDECEGRCTLECWHKPLEG